MNDYGDIVPVGWVDKNTQKELDLPYAGGWLDYYSGSLSADQKGIIGCPVQRDEKHEIWIAADKTNTEIRQIRTYGFNGDLGFNLREGKPKPMPIARYENPSKTLLMADGNNDDMDGHASYYNSNIKHYRLPEDVHSGKSNMLFLDGHVESLGLAEISTEVSESSEGRLFWYGTRI
ncbi:hypothetical protein GCM10007047_17810 [Cerasicoccus arenae]|uniref:Uncharacterized protein n=1 Tax=Cerasicoccus arenae TaxID=424488 RepID=A0A8J3GEW4_9BACT|nr:hypothetical protein GCM10007047_17810 [Cerasicoccus arenae]